MFRCDHTTSDPGVNRYLDALREVAILAGGQLRLDDGSVVTVRYSTPGIAKIQRGDHFLDELFDLGIRLRSKSQR